MTINRKGATGLAAKMVLATLLLSIALIFSWVGVSAQSTLYYKGTGALNDVANWGVNTDGSGGNGGITDFSGAGFSYIIQNSTSIVFNTGTWTVSGTGTKVYMGNPTTPTPAISLTVAPGAVINTAGQLFDVPAPASGTHKIVYQNSAPISVGTVDPNLELVFDGASFATSTSRTYGNVSLINGANIDIAGATNGPTVSNLFIEEGCTLTGPVGGSNTWIAIKAGGKVTINGRLKAGRTGGLFTANVPFPVVNNTSYATLLFNSATVTQGDNLILGSASAIEYYRGASGQTGAQTIQALNYANLTLANLSAASNKTYGAGNLTVKGTFTVNLIGAATITAPTTQNITLLPGARLLINSATAFPTPTGSGKFTLQSGPGGTASIGTLATGASIVGNVTVQQYIPGGFRKYRFLSHPFNAPQPLSQIADEIDITGNTAGTTGEQGQTVGAGFTSTATNNPSSYFFSTADANGDATTDGGWKAFLNATGTNWGVGQGIRVLTRGTKGQAGTLDGADAAPNAVTLEMAGMVNTGNIAVPLVTGGSGSTAGYNLVANPYPSPVDIGAVLTAAGANVGNAFYLRNPQTGSYITVSPIPASYVIPAHAAFFVKANAATNLNFTESNKAVCTNCPQIFNGRRAANALQLQVNANGMEVDNLSLNIGNGYDANLDNLDAEKLMNDGLSLYALSADNHKLASSYTNAPSGLIPLGIALPPSSGRQNFTLMVSDYGIDNSLKLQLHDKLTNTFTHLQKGVSYTIQVDPSDALQTGDNRLEIVVCKN